MNASEGSLVSYLSMDPSLVLQHGPLLSTLTAKGIPQNKPNAR